MLFKAKKPHFDEVNGEYVVPVRFSSEFLHSMISGWHSVGFGFARLQSRPDSSFDLFFRMDDVNADLGLIRLDAVQNVMMAAVDLSQTVLQEESMVDEKTTRAAREVMKLVSAATS